MNQANTTSVSRSDGRSNRDGLRLLIGAGLLLFVGCVTLFFLLLSPSLWAATNLVIENWLAFFEPLQDAVMALLQGLSAGGDVGVVNSRVYHLILLWLFIVYLFVVFRAFRSDVFSGFSERGGKAPLTVILVVTALLLGVLLFSGGAFTGDLYSYVWYGRVVAEHGGNPYIDVPSQYAALDTRGWLSFIYWKDLPSPYGPVWTWLASTLYIFSRMLSDQLTTHVLSHKLLAIVVHLVNIWMIWHVAERFIRRYQPATGRGQESVEKESAGGQVHIIKQNGAWWRGAQVGATLTLAWNPLVLVEFGVSGHNDGLAILALLGALWLHMAGKWRWAVLVLTIGSLVKVTEGLTFLIPYLSFLAWDTRRNSSETRWTLLKKVLARVGQAVAIIAFAWVVAWLPFWQGPATLKAFTENPGSRYSINSLGAVIRHTVPQVVDRAADEAHWDIAASWDATAIGKSLDKPVRYVLQAITALIVLVAIWRARNFRRLLGALWWTVFAYLAIGSIWYWPWYASWLLVPMALMGPGRLYTAGQIFCITSLAIHGLNSVTSPLFEWWWAWTGLIITGPPLAYLLASYLIERLRVRRRVAAKVRSGIRGEELSRVED